MFTIDRFHQIEIKKVFSLSVKFRIGAAEMGQVVSNYTANWQKTEIKVLEFQLKCFENPFGYPFNLSRRAQVLFSSSCSRGKRFTRNSDVTRKHCRIGYSTAAQKVRRHTSRADSQLFHPLEFLKRPGWIFFSFIHKFLEFGGKSNLRSIDSAKTQNRN